MCVLVKVVRYGIKYAIEIQFTCKRSFIFGQAKLWYKTKFAFRRLLNSVQYDAMKISLLSDKKCIRDWKTLTWYIKPLRTHLYLPDLKTQSLPRSKHSASVMKTIQLMLYREIIALCSEIRTKHINRVCGQNTEVLIVKVGGT